MVLSVVFDYYVITRHSFQLKFNVIIRLLRTCVHAGRWLMWHHDLWCRVSPSSSFLALNKNIRRFRSSKPWMEKRVKKRGNQRKLFGIFTLKSIFRSFLHVQISYEGHICDFNEILFFERLLSGRGSKSLWCRRWFFEQLLMVSSATGKSCKDDWDSRLKSFYIIWTVVTYMVLCTWGS